MTSFIPHNNQSTVPAGKDTIAPADAFYPSLLLSEFREGMRVDDTVSHDRVIEHIKTAMMVIANDVGSWRSQQTAATLGDISSEQATAYQRAVFYRAKAYIIENYRDIDTTNDGHEKASAMEPRIDTCLQHSREMQRIMTSRRRTSIFLV